MFDFETHLSCLDVTDPEFRTIGLICDLAHKFPDKAALADLDHIARRVAESANK